MTELQAAMRDLLDAFERHPGHPDQKVHGNWKKKLLDAALAGHGGDPFKPVALKGVVPSAPKPRPRTPSKNKVQPQDRLKLHEVFLQVQQDKLDSETALFAAVHGADPKAWPAYAKEAQQALKQNVAKAKRKVARLTKSIEGPRSYDDVLHYHRGYAAEVGGKAGDPIRFTASTPGVKRDGLDLRANGWRIDNFRKSPVFLWAHDKTSLPIGRVEPTVSERLFASVVFDQQDEFARKVESKYRRGFLHAVSVGWDFVDGQGSRMNTSRLSLDEIRDRCFYDLTELSGIPVPADPDALKEATRAGLRSLGRELVQLYDEQENPGGEALAAEVRQALYDELMRLGISPEALTRPAREAGFFMPPDPAPAVSGIDPQAARTLLAAFDFEGVK